MAEKEPTPERNKSISDYGAGGSVPRIFFQQKVVRHLEERFIRRAVLENEKIKDLVVKFTPKTLSSK